MPFFFRRSFGKGPFRLNVTSRGIGASVGVRGLRVGVNRRGTYIRAGRDGFYYQQYLDAPTRPAVRRDSSLAAAQSNELIMPDLPTMPRDEVVRGWARALKMPKFGMTIAVASVFLWIWFASLNSTHALLGLFYANNAWIASIPLAFGFILGVRENMRHIDVTYELDDSESERFRVLCDAFDSAAKSDRIWDVTATSAHDPKHNAGTSLGVTRTPAKLQVATDLIIKTNIRVPILTLSRGRVLFLPDRIVSIRKDNSLGSCDYEEVSAYMKPRNFVEDGALPSDATQVGSTWQYPNKNGGPDRRFKNNRELPIVRYDEVLVTGGNIAIQLQFSKANASASFISQFAKLKERKVT
jgi:hypothetical protein